MFKKTILLLLVVFVLSLCSVASANLGDTRHAIETGYGSYRMVLDTDNQPWTKEEWETKGHKRAKAESYTYSFTRNNLGVQMEVMYTGDKPDSIVIAQRFTPAMPIRIKELNNYFPEVYQIITAEKATPVASYSAITRQFQEQQSPVTLGVVIKKSLPEKKTHYAVVAFNIQNEGRLIKDIKHIDGDTYIREICIERQAQILVDDCLDKNSWVAVKNYFLTAQ